MDWKRAIVEVRIAGQQGSGVFVGDNLVLTAGHVLKPPASSPPPPSQVSVVYGKTRWTVKRFEIHPDYLRIGSRFADMALLSVVERAEVSMGTQLQWDPKPDEQVAVDGYPVDLTYEYQVGHAQREGALESYLLVSTDLKIVDGLSGAPLLIGDSDAPLVCGIAVWSNDTESISIPLLESTFGVLKSKLT